LRLQSGVLLLKNRVRLAGKELPALAYAIESLKQNARDVAGH
jgi:hypothetical protein